MASRTTADVQDLHQSDGHRGKGPRKRLRVRRSFTETLSSEAQAAIRSAKEETVKCKDDDAENCKDDGAAQQDVTAENNNTIPKVGSSCKLEDIYPVFVPAEEDEVAMILREDNKMIFHQNILVTPRGHIRAIDGGKLNNAMETVELVVAQDSDDGNGEVEAYAEYGGNAAAVDLELDSELRLAEMQRVSTQKCLVWLEANHRIEQSSPRQTDSEP